MPSSSTSDIDEIIDRAFGRGFEFWKSATDETFRKVAEDLFVNHGLTKDDVAEVIGSLYAATADCFGA